MHRPARWRCGFATWHRCRPDTRTRRSSTRSSPTRPTRSRASSPSNRSTTPARGSPTTSRRCWPFRPCCNTPPVDALMTCSASGSWTRSAFVTCAGTSTDPRSISASRACSPTWMPSPAWASSTSTTACGTASRSCRRGGSRWHRAPRRTTRTDRNRTGAAATASSSGCADTAIGATARSASTW